MIYGQPSVSNKHSSQYSNALVVLCLLAAALPAIVSGQATEPQSTDSLRKKAETIVKIVEYIEWPIDKVNDSIESTIIAVLGDIPLTDALNRCADQLLGRPGAVTAIDILSIERATECHLAVFGDIATDSLSAILDTLLRHNVVTIGCSRDFLAYGGLIALIWTGDKHRVAIIDDLPTDTDIHIDLGLMHMAVHTKE